MTFFAAAYRAHARGILAAAILASLAVAGCANDRPGDPDAGSDARPMPSTRTLRFSTAGPTRIEPGARVALDVELREQSGAPGAGEVRFALVGDPRDGSITPVVSRADASGLVRATLTAPSDGASLRVRASADGAPDAYLDVSVSARGFGGISITSRYTGVRAPEQLEFRIYDGVTCATADRAEPVRPVPPLPPTGGAIEFSGLAAGRTFTVRADAVGAGGVLATDCVDGLTVSRDETLYLPMHPVDLALRAEGTYGLRLQFDLGAATAGVADAWVGAVRAEAATRGSEVLYLLASIADAVEARSGAAARADFERAVASGLGEQVATDATRRGALAVSALDRFAVDVASVVRSTDAAGLASVTSEAGAPVSSLRLVSLTYTVDPLTPDVASDDLSLSPATDTAERGEVAMRPGDRVAVTLRAIPLPFTALARRAADALLARVGVGTTGEFVRLTVGCAAVEATVRGSTAACDARCVVTACNAAADRLGASFDRALGAVGAAHTVADLGFEAAARGGQGTLLVRGTEPAPITANFRDDASLRLEGVGSISAM